MITSIIKLIEFNSTQSNLAIIPAPSVLGYCASKAALNTFAMCLRSQLTDAQSNVKVIEVFPPAVQSRLILPVPNLVQPRYGKLLPIC